MSSKNILTIAAGTTAILIASVIWRMASQTDSSKNDEVASESSANISGKQLEMFVNFSIKSWPSLLVQPRRVSSVAAPQAVKDLQFSELTFKVSDKYETQISGSVCKLTAGEVKIAMHLIADSNSPDWMHSKLLWSDLIHFVPDAAVASKLKTAGDRDEYFKKVNRKMALMPPTSKIYYYAEGDVFAVAAVGETGRFEGRAWIQDKCIILEGNVLPPEDVIDLFYLVSHIELKK